MSSLLLNSTAEPVTEAVPQRPRPLARRVIRQSRRVLRRVLWAGRLAVSAMVLVGVLAILAAIPLLNIYVLGYLLAAEGRVGRGERWRNVLPWVRYAPRIAAIAFGTTLVLLPLMILADVTRDAALLAPQGDSAKLLRLGTALYALLATLHLFLAYSRGGSLLSFFRPLKNARVAIGHLRNGRFSQTIADRFWKAVAALEILPLFSLGLRGLAVAFAWLFIPCILIAAAGPANGGNLLLKFAGILLLAAVYPALLILQANFATRNRLRAGFEPRTALKLFARAPLAWLLAGTLTALLALPLFLFKIVAPPRDALWMLTPLFVAAMLPARLATGWACRRALQQNQRRNWLLITLSLAALLAIGAAYATGVFITQYINEHGRSAVFEQHAFSLPVPF